MPLYRYWTSAQPTVPWLMMTLLNLMTLGHWIPPNGWPICGHLSRSPSPCRGLGSSCPCSSWVCVIDLALESNTWYFFLFFLSSFTKIDVPPSAKYHPHFCLFLFFGDRLELEISCLVNVLLMTTTIYVMRWYRRAFTPPARFRNTSNYGSCSPILRVNLAQVSVVHLVLHIHT